MYFRGCDMPDERYVICVHRLYDNETILIHDHLLLREAAELYRRYRERNGEQRGVEYGYMRRAEWDDLFGGAG